MRNHINADQVQTENEILEKDGLTQNRPIPYSMLRIFRSRDQQPDCPRTNQPFLGNHHNDWEPTLTP